MNPSLLLIPDRYKKDKLYSQIPDSGAGDLTFARNSNATRVNSAGLIEKVRTNEILQSEAFNEAAWLKTGATITPNATIAPDGTMTADRLVFAAAENFMTQTVGLAATRSYSIYIKGTAGQTISLDDIVVFGPVVTLSGNWDRFNFTSTTGIGLAISTFQGATARDIFIWGAQAELGDITTPYIPTTTAAVSVGITADIPRLDYTGGGCPSLLLEPQRTNLITFSEQFDNAAWTAVSASVSTNASVSPSGLQDAENIVTAAANSFFGASAGVAISANGSTYTQSIFAKWISGSELLKIRAALTGGTAVAVETTVNIRTGVISTTDTTAKIENYGNGWYRVSHQITNNSTNTSFVYQTFPTNDAVNTNTLSLWGAQAELGSYPTSYINTLGSSVTRLADAASKTGISSLIGQTEGTLFLDFEKTNNDNAGLGGYFRIDVNDGSIDNRILFGFDLNVIDATVVSSGSLVAQIQTLTTRTQERIKTAFAYKANDFVLYVNGVQIGTDTSNSVPLNMANLQWGVNQATVTQTAGVINQQLIYKTRLSNADLQALTTL